MRTRKKSSCTPTTKNWTTSQLSASTVHLPTAAMWENWSSKCSASVLSQSSTSFTQPKASKSTRRRNKSTSKNARNAGSWPATKYARLASCSRASMCKDQSSRFNSPSDIYNLCVLSMQSVSSAHRALRVLLQPGRQASRVELVRAVQAQDHAVLCDLAVANAALFGLSEH